MLTNYQKVYEFHKAFGLPCYTELSTEELTNFKTVSLRIKLIHEEMTEYTHAKNTIDELDAVADMLYVIYGTGVSFGINLDNEYSNYLYQKYNQQINNSITNFDKTLLCKCNTTLNYTISTLFDKLRNLSLNILIGDIKNISNDLCSMLYNLYNLGHYHYKLNIDSLFDKIHQSNMSKLCQTEHEALQTVQWYLEHEKSRYPNPTYQKTDDMHWAVYEETTGKRLKSINFVLPKIIIAELKMK